VQRRMDELAQYAGACSLPPWPWQDRRGSLIRARVWLVTRRAVGLNMALGFWFRGREVAFAIGTIISFERIVRVAHGSLTPSTASSNE